MGTPYTLRDVKPKAKTTLPYLYPALNFSPSLAPPPPPLYLKLLHPPSSTPHLNLQLPHYHTFTLSQPWATPTLISWLSTPFDSSLSMLPSSRIRVIRVPRWAWHLSLTSSSTRSLSTTQRAPSGSTEIDSF